MSGAYDEIVVIEGKDFIPLPRRTFRDGILGKTLEDALQTLLERYPNMLPGRQMQTESGDPPRFVLLCREMPSGAGSLDHLLVDQSGILTLVEAKLMENPDARRAVIGQILEYAATAMDSWGNGRARAKAKEYWSKPRESDDLKETDIDRIICNTLGPQDPDAFWEQVEDNLRQGRLRLIIAADELRTEVRRVIEYLNVEMKRAEVFGLELRCYGKDSDRLVVTPTLFGTPQHPPISRDTSWTPEQLRSAFDRLADQEMGKRMKTVLDWAVDKGFFTSAKTRGPIFGLRGKTGRRIVSFAPDWIFPYLYEGNFTNGKTDREQLVEKLKGLDMYDDNFNPDEVSQGKNLTRKLTELDDAELSTLLDIFSQFCGTR